MQEIVIMWRLQELDRELAKVRQCALQNEKLLHNLENEIDLDNLRAALEHSEKTLHNNKKELRLHELDLQEAEAQKKKVHEQIYGGEVNNNNELQKLEHKLAALQDKKDKEENRIFELMESIEEEDNNRVILAEELEEKMHLWQEAEKKYQVLQEKIEKRKRSVLKERKALFAELEPKWQKKYELMQEKFQGTAVVKLKGNVCQGCHLQMSSGFMADIHSSNKTAVCENCHRLLYIAK